MSGWINPATGRMHVVGQRVIWVDGSIAYADTGLFGTVIAVDVPTDGGPGFTVRLDPRPPKRKRDPMPEPRVVTFTSDSVLTVRASALRTAERLRLAADSYARAAANYDENGIPL